MTFAKESSPNTRYTMVFINYKDNSYLDADGFAPFGQVVVGMDIVDKLYGGYGRTNVPDQRRIKSEGNAYLTAEYPEARFHQDRDDRTREVTDRRYLRRGSGRADFWRMATMAWPLSTLR